MVKHNHANNQHQTHYDDSCANAIMYDPFKSVVQCRVNFSQVAGRFQSCSLEPASGCHRWPRWYVELQRWGTVWNSLTGDVMSCFCLQVLQYNVETGTWTQIGTLQSSRGFHALAEVNLDAVCRPVGNLNPVKQENKIINIIITKEFSFPIYLNVPLCLPAFRFSAIRVV